MYDVVIVLVMCPTMSLTSILVVPHLVLGYLVILVYDHQFFNLSTDSTNRLDRCFSKAFSRCNHQYYQTYKAFFSLCPGAKQSGGPRPVTRCLGSLLLSSFKIALYLAPPVINLEQLPCFAEEKSPHNMNIS
ncbi:hypothetical protein GOODEAATRI_006441 [Goodea atripinnis]|uniref:Uncharacterized protein n=1 Tax=Goodea atripinnis TaxID=208336 RepID=A0ABV0P1X3_9TELE